jgi:hypothetical protein
MEKLNIKRLCDAILTVAPNVPLSYLTESAIILRGEFLKINGNLAKSNRFEFRFISPESFIESLRNFGLMLNHDEFAEIIRVYKSNN